MLTGRRMRRWDSIESDFHLKKWRGSFIFFFFLKKKKKKFFFFSFAALVFLQILRIQIAS